MSESLEISTSEQSDDDSEYIADILEKNREYLESVARETAYSDDSNTIFQENWQLSQFWYSDETIKQLSNIAVSAVGTNGKIALISCPSLYQSIKKKLGLSGEVALFEYDRRFSVFGIDYNFYDYKTPLPEVLENKSRYYDLVIADPPFLAEECLTKFSITMKHLTKDKMILCTGLVMEDLVKQLLELKVTDFEPKHQNNLGNTFGCFSNFTLEIQ